MGTFPLPEIAAMDAVYSCLKTLDPSERRRVIAWARACFAEHPDTRVLTPGNDQTAVSVDAPPEEATPKTLEVEMTCAEGQEPEGDVASQNEPAPEDAGQEVDQTIRFIYKRNGVPHRMPFQGFAEFFESVSPKSVIAKVVTCAWWLETQEKETDWCLQDILGALESVGRESTHLTTILALELNQRTPRIVPSPHGDQEGTCYRLSEAGRAYAEELRSFASMG